MNANLRTTEVSNSGMIKNIFSSYTIKGNKIKKDDVFYCLSEIALQDESV